MKRFKHNSKSFASVKSSEAANAEISQMNPDSAGIDIGSRSHFVAIPPHRDTDVVREFSSTTSGLLEICTWLKKNKITTVAMESTGSYWIPVFEILEVHGFEVYLVNSNTVKNAPGRKTDVLDSQWIQKLHSLGLLTKSFRPQDQCLKLRSLARQHSLLIEHRSPHVQHMQKALHEMNIQLATHIRDITGATGMRIINAILAGERDAEHFALLVDTRCKYSPKEIADSLVGNYREEHLFSLRQARDLYTYYSQLIQECENEVEKALKDLVTKKESEKKDDKKCELQDQSPQKKPKAKKKKTQKSHFKIPLEEVLSGFCGVDLVTVPGIDQSTALKILAELGGSVDAWKSHKHFASWLGLCPGNKVSGGKRMSGKTKHCVNKVANLLRMAANGLWNAKCYLGAYLRRLSSRKGGAKAITAVAHKLAVIIYKMIKERKSYTELGEEYYEKTYQERRLRGLVRQAIDMGYDLVPKASQVAST